MMQDWLNDTAGWGLVIGVVLPWLTAVVQQPRWSGNARRIVAVLTAAVAGALTVLAGPGLDAAGETWLQTIGAVLVASQASYATLLAPSASWVEAKTSPGTPEPVAAPDGRHAA